MRDTLLLLKLRYSLRTRFCSVLLDHISTPLLKLDGSYKLVALKKPFEIPSLLLIFPLVPFKDLPLKGVTALILSFNHWLAVRL